MCKNISINNCMILPRKNNKVYKNKIKHKCEKWELCADITYGKPFIVKCKHCLTYTKRLFKIHVEFGDYYCKCGEDVNLAYFCFGCKNKDSC
jgi:hypothetical protein